MTFRFQLITSHFNRKIKFRPKCSKRQGEWIHHCLAHVGDRFTERTLSGTGIAAPDVTTYTWDNASRLTAHTTVFGSPGGQTEHRTDYG